MLEQTAALVLTQALYPSCFFLMFGERQFIMSAPIFRLYIDLALSFRAHRENSIVTTPLENVNFYEFQGKVEIV